tara:strand:- start:332 stop:952 length:621 start_codon:yes stop_codon:yes gene_type:complete
MFIFEKLSPVGVRGNTIVEVFDKEDLDQLEPKHYENKSNTINSWLMKQIIDQMHSSSGATVYQLNHLSNWFTQKLPGGDTNDVDTDMAGKDGIFARVNDKTAEVQDPEGGGDYIYDFLLHEGLSGSVSNNTAQWVAQGSWTGGVVGSASSTLVSYLYMGKYYGPQGGTQGTGTNAGFIKPFADNNVTDFTLEVNDILKVTWSITIG